MDNAIEYTLKHDSQKPIFIHVTVCDDTVRISVANTYQQKSPDDIEKMFKSGYSTKATTGRGFGLFNLRKIVEEYEGMILANYEYKSDYNSDYLILTLNINPFTQLVPSRLIIKN